MISQEQLFDFKNQAPYNQRKHSRPKKSYKILLAFCLFVLSFSIASSSMGYFVLNDRYQQDNSLAHTGAQELETGIALLQKLPHDPFNASTINTARQNFTAALTTFSRLKNDLAFLPDALTSVPTLGTRLHAAKHLLPLAIDVSQVGLAVCSILSTVTSRLHPATAAPHTTSGLTISDLTNLNQNFQHIKIIMAQAITQVNQLQPGDLLVDASVKKMVTAFHTYLPLIQQGVDQISALFPVLPELLGIGKPSYFLVEIMDSTELRPGGGFIGNYGLISLVGGQVTSAHVIDSYLLDKSFASAHHISFPPTYSWFPFSAGPGWGLRDSNLDADFPTSARNAEMLYKQEGGTFPLAGTIAITPTLMEHILTLTGPIAVPEYNETVTAQNLIDRIHYHQLREDVNGGDVPSADGNSSARKHFTALLGQYAFARIHTLSPSLMPKLFGILIDSLHTKDLQIYFNANAAEKLLQAYHVDDSIQTQTNDGIFAVDANITPSKANEYFTTTLNDQVTIDQAGMATHNTSIKFTWNKAGLTSADFYGSTSYRGYLRVYLPSRSVLQTRTGWSSYDAGVAYGDKYWGGYFSLNYPIAGTITLTWSVAGVASNSGHNWHYVYLTQRQAGSQQQMSIQVKLPSCATMTNISKPGSVDGKQQAHFAQAVSQDTEVNLDYTC